MNATITVFNPHPTKHDVADGEDLDVLISVNATEIRGGITLVPDPVNGGMTAYGDAIDTWCSDTLTRWMRTLTDRSMRAVAKSLRGGMGTEEIEVEVELETPEAAWDKLKDLP